MPGGLLLPVLYPAVDIDVDILLLGEQLEGGDCQVGVGTMYLCLDVYLSLEVLE